MSLRKYSVIIIVLLLITNLSQATIPIRKGWWKFDDTANLTKAEEGYGVDLTLQGSDTPASGPDAGNGAVLIGPGSYYKMKHSISPLTPQKFVNEYSLQFDFKIISTGIWHSFFQTTVKNNNDGDFFINTSGSIGVAATGYSGYAVNPNDWYRMIISVNNGKHFSCYLDGNIVMQGIIQAIDGRFSLDSLLLIFADENGEDGSIYCSEISLWDQALSPDQAKELGGFGHDFSPFLMTRIPYLQGPGQNSMNICWHDTSKFGTKVDYGIDSTLSFSTTGASEILQEPFRWHTVKLTGLQSNTRYFYRVSSGDSISEVYSFKTLPDSTYTGKLRFVLLSDTHCPDTTMVGKVLQACRAKIEELYGPDIENHVNGIFHSGDITVSGNSIDQYTLQYFKPFAALSQNIATMVVAGNHEGESPYFYKYLKLDDQSAFPKNPALNEKAWEMKVGNSLFIGMNTNLYSQYGTTQANWLDSRLNETEKDTTIDFIFIFFHHPPFSELWFDVLLLDDGPDYVENVLFPIIKKYTKVQQIHTGHTHGFERGTITSEKTDGDFRIICGGGGGGALDSWGAFKNYDYNDIHIAIDHYCFQILEIDPSNNSFQNTMYSLGDLNKSRNSEALDSWYKKINQRGPATPVSENPVITDQFVQFNTSLFSGLDSLMTIELMVIDSSMNSQIVLDSLVHWKNVYGRDKNFNPIDKNRDINLYQVKIRTSLLSANKLFFYRVRYRDHNLKWSNWSNSTPIPVPASEISNEPLNSDDYILRQNYPNPFKINTFITYNIPERTKVNIRIYDTKCRLVADVNEGMKMKGRYQVDFNAESLSSGIYFYKLITSKSIITKSMVKIN